MSKILIKDAVKKYGETVVIQNLSVEIPDGSLFTLLGPSGCGKTTLLRMIAGFNSIEGGSFFFDDVLINDLDPSKRNIGMVFQNYAIFPHLSVEDNVKFGLKQRNLSKEEIQRRADYFLSLMQIEQYRTRMPAQLSGGQQQRVALARALAIHPSVLLMDEPLSNLDAKLRIDMRSVIRRIQREIGITTVYVTHDQEEAMAISDYIAIMKDGKIQHLGTAREIYHRPKNVFVAGFIGRNNIIKTMIKDKHVLLNAVPVMPLPLADQEVQLSIRPEDFSFADEGVPAKILDSTFLGSETHYRVSLNDEIEIDIVEESGVSEIPVGSSVHLKIKTEKINVFNADGSINLLYT
ncbi:ABC transporter ATP-binding protein [Treponema phagedenis]|uniref:Fe(3+) ions import ATP-binding protein FbpC n=1 Tax=Treponema phagedenis TaxID=162 RepID=A0A0B7GUU7_TREPH|nr:ABC transporter ATP-binding protein [Treponema phagedenis]QEK01241.1 ABC transporter ATP-binding protein [Treponema phagedenis]QEK03575.1 ABC transporter ATP-binding protein [Treponema phagedenis]QEK06260.1 ABC transporter ATP-binding protein [Treponema phagedenis]QEK09195.1 ABC transporter ATP-binding protein [Treponema phagedenis]QSH93559.1 ABC transporter ATP-binding protein [Treponema phagedenis]